MKKKTQKANVFNSNIGIPLLINKVIVIGSWDLGY